MPSTSEVSAQLDAIIDGRVPLDDYERFLARTDTNDDYLFAEARARFEPREEDVLRVLPDLRVRRTRHGVEIASLSLGGGIAIPGLHGARAEQLLTLIDGTRSYGELAALAGKDRPWFERLAHSALGRLLFAPEAVAALEARVSGAELVRFVGTPYELVRAYWQNMGDVREAAQVSLAQRHDATSFCREIQRLHVLTLLGASLRCFYRPASKISDQGVRPGSLSVSESETVDTPQGTLFLSGPRVGVGLVGGQHYHALLCAEDPEALAPARALNDRDGLDWGRIVTGRARSETRNAPWFCPPRPVRAAHWEKIFAAYSAARTAGAGTAEPLARFHYRFVRLHPFRCANQSLAMNLVNEILLASHGAGIPHLLLDQLALRLREDAYVALFSRAVREHGVRGSAAERWSQLRQRKLRAYELIARLQSATDLETASRLAAANPSAAAAALIEIRGT